MDRNKKQVQGNQNCSVPQCNSVRYKCSHLSFHRFPKDKNLSKIWEIKLKIGKKIGNSASVCSLHFKPEDFHPQTNATIRPHLKKGTVPSQKLPMRFFDKARSSQDSRKERMERRLQLATAQAEASELVQSLLHPDMEHPPTSEIESSEAAAAPLGCNEAVGGKVDAAVQVVTLELMLQNNIMDLINTEQKLSEATGISSFTMLKTLTALCAAQCQSTGDMTADIMLALMKAKHSVPFTLLSILFGVSKPTAARKFKRTIKLLASILSFAVRWPNLEEVRENIPRCFAKFRNTRVVVDCTEIPLYRPKCLTCRQLTYSQYKGQHTVKVMIGVSPAGLVTFVSKVYGGRASDKAIFEQSGIIDLLEPFVDAVMVDKGFLVDDICARNCVQLYRPPFLKDQKQFNRRDAMFCAEIARARVHVERVIGRMKTFSMLTRPLHGRLLESFEAVLTVAAGLANLARPVLGDARF